MAKDDDVGMQLKLVTLLGEKLNKPIYEAVLFTKNGTIGIFPGHEPLVTLLVPGTMMIRYHKDDSDLKMDVLAISGGLAEITRKEIIILADEAESDSEISEKEARAAYERAVAAIKNVESGIELEEAKRLVQHQAARLKVAELRRRHREMK